MPIHVFPDATGNSFAYVTRDSIPRVLYVGQNSRIHEFRHEASGWFHADLSELSQAPGATGSPFAQVTPDSIPRVLYVGQDSGIHELRFEGSQWKHAPLLELSDTSGAPRATGSPFAQVTPDSIPRVLYVGQDGHIHELRLEGSGWKHADLTSISAANADFLTLDSGPLATTLAISGSVGGVMNKRGDFNFNSHAHDSGFDNIDYTISAVLMTPTGFAFTFQHSGHTEGTIAGLPLGTPNRDSDFVAPAGNNPLITTNWNEIVQGRFSARIDGTDTLVGGVEGVLGDIVKAAAVALGQAGAKAVIALV